jgi:hypothetical protein
MTVTNPARIRFSPGTVHLETCFEASLFDEVVNLQAEHCRTKIRVGSETRISSMANFRAIFFKQYPTCRCIHTLHLEKKVQDAIHKGLPLCFTSLITLLQCFKKLSS